MSDVTMSNTKKEIIEAYQNSLKKISELEKRLLKPEKAIQNIKNKDLKVKAKEIVAENLEESFSTLKVQINRLLSESYSSINDQISKYKTMEETIQLKEKELKEIYDIEKNANTLVALIEAQNDKKTTFETEISEKRTTINAEIKEKTEALNLKKKEVEDSIKTLQQQDKEKRIREEEEFKYEFNRKKIKENNALEDELQEKRKKLNEEIHSKEKELQLREETISKSEEEFTQLKNRAQNFENEMNKAVEKAIEHTTEKVQLSLKHELELKEKQLNGEKEVLITKIGSLENKVKEQSEMILSLSSKLEKSYEKVQNVAIKAIEGASNSSFRGLKEIMSENSKHNE